MNPLLKILCIGLLSVSFHGYLIANETGKIPSNLDFSFLKKTDGSKLLKANLYIMVDRKVVPVINVPVIFNVNSGTKNITVNTNNDGIAYLIVDKDTKLTTEEDGRMIFKAIFEGNDTLENIEQEISLKDATIRITFDQVDSVRTVNAQLLEINGSDTIPSGGQTVNFYVPRMFSLLKIAEETTDESGNISFEFPNDLPGQKNGMIAVVAKLEDNEIYANIEIKRIIKWGIPLVNPVPESHRTLWTEVAPLWMIITLSIMLAGVWGHYIYTIVQLFLIRREGKNIKE